MDEGVVADYIMSITDREIKILLDEVYEMPSGVALIQANSLWEKGDYGEGIVIGVVDTGCDTTHPDLKDRVIGGRNFTTEDDSNPDIYMDYNGHGTHVCGTIAASMNGSGVVGVAPKSKLLILKVANKKGDASYKAMVKSINYAIEKKVDIISISMGGEIDYKILHDAIKRCVKNNILVVCAASNEMIGEHPGICYPAGYVESIAVGAVDYSNLINITIQKGQPIDLVAPGVEILSTYLDGKFAIMSGTSMAVPHVTGALALLINATTKEFGRRLSESEMYAQLIKRTFDLGKDKLEVGNGCIFLSALEILHICIMNKFLLEKKNNNKYIN